MQFNKVSKETQKAVDVVIEYVELVDFLCEIDTIFAEQICSLNIINDLDTRYLLLLDVISRLTNK